MIYPFRHLDAYEREDIAFYFGREKDIEKLYQMTFETDLLLVYGASGVGKSSLIRCGLANKFGSYEWEDFWIRKKGKNITASLIDELNKKMKDESNKTTIYEQTFEQKRDRIREQIQILLRKHFKPIYLIFDQFEELYTSGNEEEQNEFYEIVKDILSLNQPVKIIISIREEYLGYLYYFEEVIPYLFSHKYWVKPLKLEVEENSVIDKILESVIKNKDESIVSIKDGDKERLTEGIKQMFKNAETSTVDLPSLQILFDEFYFLCGGDSSFKTKVDFSYDKLEKKLNENIQDIVWNYLEKWVLGKVKDIKIKTEIVWRFLEKLVSGKGTKEILSEEDLIKYVFGTEEIRQIKALFNQKNDELDPIKQNENGTWELRHDTLAKCINEKLVPELHRKELENKKQQLKEIRFALRAVIFFMIIVAGLLIAVYITNTELNNAIDNEKREYNRAETELNNRKILEYNTLKETAVQIKYLGGDPDSIYFKMQKIINTLPDSMKNKIDEK